MLKRVFRRGPKFLHFLNLIYLKLAEDRQTKIVTLNQAGKITPVVLQFKFRSILEILESFFLENVRGL